MDPLTAGLQALSIFRGGAQSPSAQSSSAGSFAGQTLIMGNTSLPDWLPSLGGSGPGQAMAFGQPRADSYVMGLTGLNTATGYAAGSGIAVQNTPTQQYSMGAGGNSWMVLGLVAAGAVALTLLIKG